MAEPYTSSISSTAMDKINTLINQRKMAGRRVEPWEVESMMKAALSTEADRASGNYFRGKELALREEGMNLDQAYREKALESADKANVGSMLTSGVMLNYMMKDPKTGVTPLGEWWNKGTGGKGVLDTIKTGVNKLTGTGGEVAAGTQTGTLPATNLADAADQGGFYDTAMEGGGTSLSPADIAKTSKGWTDYALPAGLSFVGGRIVGKSKVGQKVGETVLMGRGGESERGAVSGGAAAGLTSYLITGDPVTAGVSTLFGALGG